MLWFCLAASPSAWADSNKLVFSSIDSVHGEKATALLQEAYARLGYDVSSVILPAARCLVATETGAVDGEVLRTKRVEKRFPNLIRIDVPLHTTRIAAFTCSPDIEVTGWESIEDYHVGIRTGISYLELATRDFTKVTKRIRPEHLFEQLSQGRIEVVIANPEEADAYKALNPDTCITMRHIMAEFPLYHYLNKKNAHLVPEITHILRQLQQDELQ